MPDITMCINSNCPLRERCYRYRAVPDDYWQSFAMYKPETQLKCDYFWQINWVNNRILPLDIVDKRNRKDDK